jgi:hypothetical protein
MTQHVPEIPLDGLLFAGVEGGLQPFAPSAFRDLTAGRLVWLPEAGAGYFECEAGDVYDGAYFERYAAQAATPTGRRLMEARVDLVRRHLGDIGFSVRTVLDVGIGSGAFVEALLAGGGDGAGYDVNPAGVEWLEDRGLYQDLYARGHGAVTFWDSLEHIREPDRALACCADWVFVALPIFRDAAHVLASKHFRRDEHYWYFTRDGFRAFADAQGFDVVDMVATETALGREDVETFVLRRRR